MSRFTQPLVVMPLSEYRRAKKQSVRRGDVTSWIILTDDLRYEVGQEGSGVFVVIERGFVTDFASVPFFLRWALPKWDVYGPAAALHDWGYWTHGDHDRHWWDTQFRVAMEATGVPSWKRRLLYEAVHHLGGPAWTGSVKKTRAEKIIDDVDDVIAAKKS